MAVYAAHLTRTLQGTPSVFQVTAQEALGATVKPAIRKLVEYLSAVHPNKCGWAVRWFDELYLLFDCCLQYHYLKHYAGSFAETFYGLLRVPTSYSSEFSSGQRLPKALERGSLLLLTLLPYLKDKADRIIEKWREDYEDGRLGKSHLDRCRKAAIRVYSIVHLIMESVRLVQLCRYLTGGSSSHCPELALLGLQLRDAPLREDDEEHSWSDLGRALRKGQLGAAVVTFPMVGGAVLRAVEWGAFGVQFLRWWEDRGRAPRLQPRLPPPAPPREQTDIKCKNKCPLCLQTWKIPTVLPVSGYMFCYVCISRHLRRHRACPLTHYPAAGGDLVRVYLD